MNANTLRAQALKIFDEIEERQFLDIGDRIGAEALLRDGCTYEHVRQLYLERARARAFDWRPDPIYVGGFDAYVYPSAYDDPDEIPEPVEDDVIAF